jgi:hypothetical protein
MSTQVREVWTLTKLALVSGRPDDLSGLVHPFLELAKEGRKLPITIWEYVFQSKMSPLLK